MIKIQSTAPTVLHDRSDRFNTAFYTVFSRLNSIYIFHFPLSTKSFHFHLYLYRAISKSKCENNLLLYLNLYYFSTYIYRNIFIFRYNYYFDIPFLFLSYVFLDQMSFTFESDRVDLPSL